MNRIKESLLAFTILTIGALSLTPHVHAACQLVDPVSYTHLDVYKRQL